MILILDRHDAIAGFVGRGLGTTILPPYTAIGWASGNEIVGGAVFNCWNGSNIELTLYAPNAIYRGVVLALKHYAFEQLGALRVSATTRRGNVPVRKMLPRAGFEFEGVAKQFFGPTRADDGLRFVLRRER